MVDRGICQARVATCSATRFRRFFLAYLFLFAATAHAAEKAVPDGDWRYYGGDAGSTKYSTLDQINADNVSKLKIAWTWDSPDLPLQKENRSLGSFAYEPTPLAVGGTLYTSTSLAQVAAIDGRTGETIWVFNPEVYKAGRPTNLGYVHRGLAYWTGDGEERLYVAGHDAYLYCVDAKTGKLDQRVSATKAASTWPRPFRWPSTPAITR